MRRRLAARSFSAADVLRLKLWHDVGAILSQERRQRLFGEIDRRPAARPVKADALVIVDVGEARKQIASRARALAAAESAVSRSAAVMGGEPVFKGTRIPVRMIASMLDAGVGVREILDGYPKLRAEHLDLARLWAIAHPRRGRPKSLADRGIEPVSRLHTPLRANASQTDSSPPSISPSRAEASRTSRIA